MNTKSPESQKKLVLQKSTIKNFTVKTGVKTGITMGCNFTNPSLITCLPTRACASALQTCLSTACGNASG